MNLSDVTEDKNISQAIEDVEQAFFILTKRKFGIQYSQLARFAKNIGNLELGVEKGSKVIDTIKTYGDIEKIVDPEIGEYYIVNKSISQNNIIIAYGNFHFPLAITLN